jgi:hypothetical protein
MHISKALHHTYFVEHILQILLGVDPRGNSITEEDEVLYHTLGVVSNHSANTTESGVLFFIVADIAQ